MIILTSNGLSSDTMIDAVKPFVSGCTRAAIVTTASVGYKENDRHIPRLASELEQINLSVDFFDFDTQRAELLLDYDVVEINGGNPFYLLRAMQKENIREVMEKIAKKKLFIGVSAGSVVLQKNIKLIAGYSPELNDGIGLTDMTGLGLTNLEILPHYHRFITRFDRFEERVRKYEITNNCEVIRLDDGAGVIVCENGYEFI